MARLRYDAITNEQIAAAKDKLPKDWFDVLCASAEGASYATMAADMNIKVGTVKSRLNRAREAMLKILPPEETIGRW